MINKFLQTSIAIALGISVLAVFLSFFHIIGHLNKNLKISTFSNAVLHLRLEGLMQEGGNFSSISLLLDQLKQAETNSNIKAILLEINSPGGTVGASKRLYEALIKLREKKPIVAWVSGMGASGAFYAASACAKIIASEASILGSIGVVSLRFELYRFLEQYKIKADTFKAGRFKDMGSPFREMKPKERRMYQALLDNFYNLFLEDVAKGRKAKLSLVKTWADGKIFSSQEAKKLKMIDALGEKEKALEELRKLLRTKSKIKLIEPLKDIEYYLQRYLSSFFLSPKEKGAYLLLEMPALYLYPQFHILQSLFSHTLGNGI